VENALDEINTSLRQIIWQNNRDFDARIRFTPKATLTTLVVSLVEHCNLGCWGCDHFAPLAEKKFLNKTIFERDIKRLAELSKGTVGTIKLMGGEPLLHPQKEIFFQIARENFSNSRIELVTNGILLEKQIEEFWTSCNRNRIVIVATKYPLDIHWDKIIQKSKEMSVEFNFYSNSEELKTSLHIPFDVTGTQDTAINFMNCYHANSCRELLGGRMYTCTIAPHVQHFNKFFGQNLELSELDSIDIYTVKDMADLLSFLARPIPFCRYCNVLARSGAHPWQKSKREMSEWTV
jgi:hypothetical protein